MNQKKKKCRKVISYALALVMVFSTMTGIVPFMDTSMTVKADSDKIVSGLGTSAIKNPTSTGSSAKAWAGSYVYYGKYDGTSPTKYRVLDRASNDFGVSGGSLLLECDTTLYNPKFDDSNNTWSSSSLRSGLQGDAFLNKSGVFTEQEKGAIASSTKNAAAQNDGEGDDSHLNWASLSSDTVFVLDAKEATRSSYGYATDKTRRKSSGSSAYGWWLRSPGKSTVYQAGQWVYQAGYVCCGSTSVFIDSSSVNSTYYGVSPAFNINLSSVIFASAISGQSGSYKLTLKDDKMSIALTSGQKVTKSGDTLTIPYTVSGDNAGNANQVSVLVTDKAYTDANATIKKYGKLATDGSFVASGTGTFALPGGLTGTLGTDYHIYLLAEDVNGEKETDYANLKEITAGDIGVTTKDNLVYNGSEQDLVEAPEGSNYLYSLTGADNSFNATIPKGKNADTYTVYYKETAGAVAKNLTAKIAKKEVTVDGIAVSDKVYDGTTSAVLDYTNVTYKKDSADALVSGDTLTVTATGAFADANVGDSKSITISNITLGGASAGNYTLAASGNQSSATGKITKKPVTVTAKAQTVDVNGTIQIGVSEAELSGAVDGHTLTAVTLTAGNVTTVGSSIVTPSNATIQNGNTDVTSNYEITYTAGTLTVIKAQPKLKSNTTLTAGSLTYGETLADSQVTGTMVDKYNEATEVAGTFAWKEPETKPQVSDSGVTEYDVLFTPTNDNYCTVGFKVKLTVNKAKAVIKTEPAKIDNLTYDGSAQKLVTAGATDDGTIKYALTTADAAPADEAYTYDNTNIPAGTYAGTYYVWYKVIGDANHNDSALGFVEAKINPVDKTDLNSAIEEAEAYYNTIKDNSDYSEQKEALGSAISTAKSLAENDNVTATEVSEGITAVNTAKNTAKTAVEGIIESNEGAFATEKTKQKNNADSLAKDGDSDVSRKLIEDAKKAIDAIDFDNTKTLDDNKAALADIITKLTEDLTTQRAADKLATDKATFEVEKTTKQKAADALSEELDSDASKKLITDAKAAIEALTYDETKSLDENKAAIEAVIKSLKTDLVSQRTEDLATNKETFGADKEPQKKAADNLAVDGDSDASKRLIEDAKKAIDELAYDETKSLDENKEALAAIVSKLKDDLTAKRAEEKKEADDTAVAQNVTDIINALPASTSVTINDKNAIEAARKAYDALTADQKKKVSDETLKKLTDAETALVAAEKKAAEEEAAKKKDAVDKAVADKVIAAINKLPASDKVATTDKAAIEAARKAYDALTADQKKKVSADVLKKLTDAETALATATAKDKEAKELVAAKEEAQAAMNELVTVTQNGNKFTVKWTKSSFADGYYVYASYCGKKATKPTKTIKKNTTTKTTITKINGKKINQKKNFHVYVVPYKIIDGKNVILGKSTVAHVVGAKNTKYSNVKKLTLTKKKYIVKVGKTAKIKAKVTLVNKNKKHIPKSHGAKFRYKSSDTSIATVDKNGKIKGIKKGTCTIYVYSINGLTKKAQITVK